MLTDINPRLLIDISLKLLAGVIAKLLVDIKIENKTKIKAGAGLIIAPEYIL